MKRIMEEMDQNSSDISITTKELEDKPETEFKKSQAMEEREEQLLRKLVDKEKAFNKLQNVVAEYEKAISEMITEKEILIQQYEAKFKALKDECETNAHHLTSLEATFSDLHSKYERTKQLATDLKEREASLIEEKTLLEESLKIQEQRYEKMKNHAVLQLENANSQLEEQLKVHQVEITKLRAQLKKEEVSRASVQEQLSQKSKENEELVKICDELINGGGSN